MGHPFITVLLSSLLYSASSLVVADSLSVEVLDNKQRPLSGIIVSLHGDTLPPPEPKEVVSVQEEKRFNPQILLLTQGSKVVFENKDDITHHVYSFSEPWKEQFRLQSNAARTFTFDIPGRIDLGCNIHDWMLSYIYVLDTDIYGFTDVDGKFSVGDLPEGQYTLRIQHPRIRDGRGIVEQTVTIRKNQVSNQTVSLKKNLLAKRDQIPEEDFY